MTDQTLDPYALDTQQIIDDQNKKAGGSKVKWHNLPDGEIESTWRIFPFMKRRTFFVKVQKHFRVPGFKGSITCPRSFDNPDNPKYKLPCAICEKFFEMYKSKDPADQTIAKLTLRANTSYYVNAVNVEKPEDGVGVLNIPHSVWEQLFAWLTKPKFQTFSHPHKGRNIIVQPRIVQGTSIPGQENKPKRNYTVIPDEPTPITNMEWLEQLYDLDNVVGIPTWELTQVCVERLLANSADAASLPDGAPAYRGQLATGQPPSVAETMTGFAHQATTEPSTGFAFGGNEQPETPSVERIETTRLPQQPLVGNGGMVETGGSTAPRFSQAPTTSSINTTPVVGGTGTQTESDIRKLMEDAMKGVLPKK